MRKLIALALVLILALSLAACGGNDTPSSSGGNGTSTPPTSQGGTSTTPPSSSTTESTTPKPPEQSADIDTSTLSGYLSQFGFTEDDIAIANLTENIFHADSKMIEIHTSSTPANAELQECVERIYEKSRATSDSGEVYIYGSEDKFVLSDIVDWSFDWKSSPLTVYWEYAYQGKGVMVAINWFASDMTSLAIMFEEN